MPATNNAPPVGLTEQQHEPPLVGVVRDLMEEAMTGRSTRCPLCGGEPQPRCPAMATPAAEACPPLRVLDGGAR